MLVLWWIHFFHNDPADGVPASVCVPSRVALTGTHIERYFYRSLGDSWAVSLDGSRANDVPRTTGVNRRVDWHGALGTVKCEEPSVTGTCCNDAHVSLVNNSEVCIAVLLDK